MLTKRERYLKQAAIPALARPGDPLVSEHGMIIKPERIKKDVKENQPELTAKTFRASKKRTLQELPATPAVVNGCAAVIFYTILGLGDREIATAIKVNHADVLAIKEHPAYSECFDIIAKEFVNANSALLSARIGAYAHDAVTRIADISANGKKEENVLRASVDLADRAMGTKGGISQQSGGNINELRIVIVDGERKPIDVRVEPINGEHYGNQPE